MATTNMNIRMDSEIKTQAQQIFSQFGLDMTTAINMFLRQVIRQRGIPFNLQLETDIRTEAEMKADVATRRTRDAY